MLSTTTASNARWLICRICLKNGGQELYSIFDQQEKATDLGNLQEKIELYGGIKVSYKYNRNSCMGLFYSFLCLDLSPKQFAEQNMQSLFIAFTCCIQVPRFMRAVSTTTETIYKSSQSGRRRR